MKLTELLSGIRGDKLEIIGSLNPRVLGITANSNDVDSGFLFAALKGSNTDGLGFVGDALKRGAVGIIGPGNNAIENYLKSDSDVSLIKCEQPRRAYAKLSALYYKNQPKVIVGITGTNGKSSVADFIRQFWAMEGVPGASIGTLGLVTPRGKWSGTLTTPDPAELHKCLNKLATDNIDHLALEASSHGLSQYRLDGVSISVGVFTNLSRDHLDYHESMKNYLSAKKRLFSELLPVNGDAILNADDHNFEIFYNAANSRNVKILSYGWEGEQLRILDLQPDTLGQSMSLSVEGIKTNVCIPLIGEFQAMNALCALGVALRIGMARTDAIHYMENLVGVRGRLELAGITTSGASIYVDYAHTPDALANVLSAVRPHTVRNLNLVFGCGGDRDIGKRKAMGAVASRLADNIIITDDNPRNEDASGIRLQIVEACHGAKVIEGRDQAISAAIEDLEGGDALIIAGKGHETLQIIGSEEIPFDDVELVKEIISGKK